MPQDIIINHTSKDSGKVYIVNLSKKSCSCPDWRNRQSKVHGICKHLKEELNKRNTDLKDYSNEILHDNDSVHFIDKYGEETLNMLILQGIVFEKNGKLFLL